MSAAFSTVVESLKERRSVEDKTTQKKKMSLKNKATKTQYLGLDALLIKASTPNQHLQSTSSKS